ncbi:hypothetical protein QVD17_03163 [Tagetes erecta]|uniref:RING-type domain-containing protein n=1 Tax=Tagetes erecta TaxID=13708 RepID=A0AAD8P9Q6_TARER|nr:hypothetical protein QVD17_03163 [Tagetes erecta]
MFGEKLRLKLVGSVCTTTVPTIASHVRVSTDDNRLTTRNGTNRLNSPPVTQTANVRIETPVEENRRNGGDGGEPATVKMTLMSLLEIDASNAHVSTDSNRLTTRNDSSRLNSQSPPVSNDSSLPVTQVAIVRDETPVVEDEQTEEENRREPATVKVTLMSLLEINASACFGDDDEEDKAVVEDDGGGDRKYNKCCVCMVRNKGAAFIPCGHTFCRVCSREVFVKRATCPLCNHFISEILDIF